MVVCEVMRSAVLAAVALLLAVSLPVAAEDEGPSVIQFWYRWGNEKIGGANVWTHAATNLTMSVEVSEQNGTPVEEITEFHVHVVVPGSEPYPPTNGTNMFPHPQISGVYDTVQMIRDPDHCVRSNNSQGFECGVPINTWNHSVLQIRFLRLLEFTDSNGDGGYTSGEPVLSEQDLADPSFEYASVFLDGLNETHGSQALPFRIHHPDTCCGESWEGWIGQNDTQFPFFDGLVFRLSATGPPNVTVTGYQWFRPRTFQGVNLTPLQVKLDLTIQDYPFVDSGSRLAWELNFTSFSQGSSTNWELVPWPEGQAIGADSANATAIFAWSSNATADGERARVVGTIVTVDDFSRHVFLGYPQASLIHHDPVLGVTDKRIGGAPDGVVPPSFSPSLSWIAFIVTLAVASLAIYTTERRKR
jgi:hypothetical protein